MPRGVAQRADGRTKVDEHIETIKSYLYEEGPQTSEHLSSVINLAQSRTLEILTLMKLEGSVDSFQRGVVPTMMTYWFVQ